MTSFSSASFSTSAFSVNAWDFGSTPPTPDPGPILLGGGPGETHNYVHPYQRRQQEEFLQAQRDELARIDEDLANAERSRQELLAEAEKERSAMKAAKQLVALEASLQAEIDALRIERVRLMRLIDDEEAIIALLMSSPFH